MTLSHRQRREMERVQLAYLAALAAQSRTCASCRRPIEGVEDVYARETGNGRRVHDYCAAPTESDMDAAYRNEVQHGRA